MSLTLPRAGRIAGRAPELRVPTPEIGNDIAQMGQVMQSVGTAIEAEQHETIFSRRQIDMMEGFNQIRLELDQVGDPIQREALWAERTGQLRGQILDGAPARLHERLGLRFDDMRVRTAYAEGRAQLDLVQSAARADLARGYQATQNYAATTDEGTALEEYAAMLDRQVSAGTITPEQAQRNLQSWQSDRSLTTATALLRDDPGALLAQIDQGALPGLEPHQLETWRTRAQAALDTRTTAENTALGRTLQEATRVLLAGYDHEAAEALANDPRVAEHEHGAAFLGALSLRRQEPGFAALPPAMQRDLLEAREALPVPEGRADEIQLRAALRAQHDATVQAWREDPITHAQQLGILDPGTLPDPLTTSPQDLARALATRQAQAAALRERGYVQDPVLFTATERAAFQRAGGVDATPEQRANLATAAALAFGADAPEYIDQISEEPVFRFVGGLVASGLAGSGGPNGQAPILAREIMEGHAALGRGDVPVPSQNARRNLWFQEFGSLFDTWTEGGLRDEVIAAADALYAFRMRGNPDAGDQNVRRDTYLQAVHEAVGGTGDFSRGSARGGVQQVRGALTFLPPGIRGRDVDGQLETLARGLSYNGQMDMAFGPEAEQFRAHTGQMDRIWRSLSPDQAAPQIGGELLNARTAGSVQLRNAGGPFYFLQWTNGDGQVEIVLDENGQPYRLDLERLMEWRP